MLLLLLFIVVGSCYVEEQCPKSGQVVLGLQSKGF